MATSRAQFRAQIAASGEIPRETRVYFRARLRSRLHEFLLGEFLKRQEEMGMTRAAIANRIDKDASQITRWLAVPSNLELDTISDLLLAMGREPEFTAVLPLAEDFASATGDNALRLDSKSASPVARLRPTNASENKNPSRDVAGPLAA